MTVLRQAFRFGVLYQLSHLGLVAVTINEAVHSFCLCWSLVTALRTAPTSSRRLLELFCVLLAQVPAALPLQPAYGMSQRWRRKRLCLHGMWWRYTRSHTRGRSPCRWRGAEVHRLWKLLHLRQTSAQSDVDRGLHRLHDAWRGPPR